MGAKDSITHSAKDLCIPRSTVFQPSTYVLPPPLTRVNRQARSETLPIFYTVNSFHVSCSYLYYSGRSDQVSKWLLSIGKHARSLSSLKVSGQIPLPTSLRSMGSNVSIETTLHLTPENVARSELLTVQYECLSADRPAYGEFVVEKLAALKAMLSTCFESRTCRTLSCNDWITMLECVDTFYGRSYAPYPVAVEDE